MKLFFDENLSPKLVPKLINKFPGSEHVRNVGLKGSSDDKIWEHCKKENFIIVSKDTDFRERSFLEGFPPKIIWLDVGNVGTKKIVQLLEKEYNRIQNFANQKDNSLLILSIAEKAI